MRASLRWFGRRREEPKTYEQTFPRVRVFEWRPIGGAINFGDHLSRVIVNRVLAQAGLTEDDETARDANLFAVGSVLHFAQNDDTVWGSGINGKTPIEHHRFSSLDVRAVRGPKTAAFLQQRGIEVPAVYGDPALLLPRLFGERFKRASCRPVVVVPNLHDSEHVVSSFPVISPLWGWNRVVDEILTADFVIASSLHGVIVAEAFGIPARYVRLSETENLFKYDDYAQGTGRDRLEPATSIDEAVEMGGMPPIAFDADALLAAFPWDLWERSRA